MTLIINRKYSFLFIFFITLIAFTACKATNKTKVKTNKNIEINNSASENNFIDSMILPYKKELDAQMNQVLNTADMDLLKGRPESNLGNLVTDLSLEISKNYYHPADAKEIDFCLLNDGGLRTSIAQGPITLGKVFEVMPFENELVVVTLNYDSTMALFEHISKRGEPISNAKLIVKSTGELIITVNGLELKRGKSYKVLTTDYLARGGDKMTFFSSPENHEVVGIKLRDAIIEYFVNEAEAGNSISSNIEGRLSYE